MEDHGKLLRSVSGIGGISDRMLSTVLKWVRSNPAVLDGNLEHETANALVGYTLAHDKMKARPGICVTASMQLIIQSLVVRSGLRPLVFAEGAVNLTPSPNSSFQVSACDPFSKSVQTCE